VDGSGTADRTPTVKPYQFSNVGSVQEILSKFPQNSMLPLPSFPDTVLPATVIANFGIHCLDHQLQRWVFAHAAYGAVSSQLKSCQERQILHLA